MLPLASPSSFYRPDRSQAFLGLRQWLSDARHSGRVNSKSDVEYLLVANKIDESAWQVSEDEAREWADSEALVYVAVSAKTGENVQEVCLRSITCLGCTEDFRPEGVRAVSGETAAQESRL